MPDFCAPARMKSSRSTLLGLTFHIVINQGRLTASRNRSPLIPETRPAEIPDFCNLAVQFLVSSCNGCCFEGLHARNVDFLRDHNRCLLHCLACHDGSRELPGYAQRNRASKTPRRRLIDFTSLQNGLDRQLVEPELSRPRQHFMLLDVHCFRNFAKTKTACRRVCN